MSSQASCSNAPDENPEQTKLLVNFNQDFTFLCVGNKVDWSIWELNNGEQVEKTYRSPREEVYILEKLFSSSLVAVVTVDAPRMLKVRHYKRGSEICNYTYMSSIMNVKLNRLRLCVILRDSIHIHNIKDMQILHTIREAPPNIDGLCALSWGDEKNQLLAYPGCTDTGCVQIFDASNLLAKPMIQAHTTKLVALAFNNSGSLLATASVKGTLIRVYSTKECALLVSLRRSILRCTTIHNLSFSNCGNYLGVSSETETVHVFKLPDLSELQKRIADESWMGYFHSFLPKTIADSYGPERDFASIQLPGTSNVRKVIGIKEVGEGRDKQLRLFIAREDGLLHVCNVDTNGSGAIHIYKTENISPDANGGGGPDPSPPASYMPPNEGSTLLGSYAGILKGNPPGQMSESDKLRVVMEATATPPKDNFHLTYEQEYPPLSQD